MSGGLCPVTVLCSVLNSLHNQRSVHRNEALCRDVQYIPCHPAPSPCDKQLSIARTDRQTDRQTGMQHVVGFLLWGRPPQHGRVTTTERVHHSFIHANSTRHDDSLTSIAQHPGIQTIKSGHSSILSLESRDQCSDVTFHTYTNRDDVEDNSNL